MTASLHRLGAGAEAGLYYTNDSEREARPDRRDEYYLADGGGVWWSSGESVVRHELAFSTFGAGLDEIVARDSRFICDSWLSASCRIELDSSVSRWREHQVLPLKCPARFCQNSSCRAPID